MIKLRIKRAINQQKTVTLFFNKDNYISFSNLGSEIHDDNWIELKKDGSTTASLINLNHVCRIDISDKPQSKQQASY